MTGFGEPDPQTQLFCRLVERESMREPGWHELSPAELRARLARGFMGPPPARRDDLAEDLLIEGPGGPLPVRIFIPPEPLGVFLHIHGGGFVCGGQDHQDEFLWARAESANAIVVSVGYRLAPENPYPAAPDDCEAAALWLIREAQKRWGLRRFVIGGESAGGNLSAVTLLRLRDRHGLARAFSGAVLTYGGYDMQLSPSARHWGPRRLVLSTPLIRYYRAHYLGDHPRDDPDVSPVYANLAGLPPAHFTVGTADPLLDDTLFMEARWRAAGLKTDLRVFPGAPHSFDTASLACAREANAAIDRFISCSLVARP